MASVLLMRLRVLCVTFAPFSLKRFLFLLRAARTGILPALRLILGCGAAAVVFEHAAGGHRFDKEFAQGPDQRVDSVGRIAGRAPVEIAMRRWAEGAHLVLELRQGAE